MVAPAGVSEGTPQEPAKAGMAPVELAEAEPAKAVPAPGVPAQGVPVQGVAAAGAVPVQGVPVQGVPVQAVAAGAVPARAAAAQEAGAEAVPVVAAAGEGPPAAEAAEGELVVAAAQAAVEPAETEPTKTEPAETEPAEAHGPGRDAEEQSRDISLLAVVGIIVGIIALAGAAVGVLAVVTHGFRPKTVITYRPAAVFGLRPGECVNTAANGLSATVRSCATPHDAEVFATFTLQAGAWPGAAAVQQDAGSGCETRLSSYLNPQLATADLTQEYIYPDRAAWQAGERTVVCEVSAVSGKLTGSVRAKS